MALSTAGLEQASTLLSVTFSKRHDLRCKEENWAQAARHYTPFSNSTFHPDCSVLSPINTKEIVRVALVAYETFVR